MKSIVVCVAILATVAQAADWAVIVAGSNTYGNYRHQSDACHAVQIVKKNGITPDHIINMVYDDIANNPSNPYKGQVFNKPTAAGTPGFDVYNGCQKDYTGQQVTAANFLKVLTGDTSAPGKVLKTTANDNVFVYFTDHGGVGIVAFPVGPYLGVKDLQNALNTMYTKKTYNKLVFYMEACEAGSMFEGTLPTNRKIYATTAANAHESSYGFYCPPQDKVNGKSIGSCLGDEYSIQWLENTDNKGVQQTLQAQYTAVRDATKMSHVMQYGDTTFTSDILANFLGDKLEAVAALPDLSDEEKEAGRVDSRDIPMHLAYYEYLRADKKDLQNAHRLARKLIDEIDSRIAADTMFMSFSKAMVGETRAEEVFKAKANLAGGCGDCCDAVNHAIYDWCGGYTDYSMQYSRIVWNTCVETQNTQKALDTLRALCGGVSSQ
jgi:legumain